MFENSGTRRQSRRHCNTRRRGSEAGGYKRRAPGAGADRERERPREALAISAPAPPKPREKDALSLGPNLIALPEHPIPLLTGLLDSVSPHSPRLFQRATMNSGTAKALAVAVTLLHLTRLALSTCPAACHCPLEAPKCAPGVGLVRDDCGCCKVCAKQLNEDCSKMQPCDHTKGLECNFGASSTALKGICRAQSEGRPCEYNSRIYQNGESFQPNCKHQCTCIDGAVGCIPLCPQELSLPNLGCPNPRLVKVSGQCCEEWVCDEDSSIKDPLDDQDDLFGFDASEVELTRKNELIAVGKGSSCSKSCGTGISTRVTNDNPECRLLKETRICEVRPCGQPVYSSLKKGKKCSKTKKSPEPVRFNYAGCSSVKKYRPKYCGSCVDGRCCTPLQTRTVKMRFRCEDGEMFSKNVMMIQSCKCNYNCPHPNEASFRLYSLFNDIHKFRD
ncbi:CCN family member 1 [Lemmus lemmus]